MRARSPNRRWQATWSAARSTLRHRRLQAMMVRASSQLPAAPCWPLQPTHPLFIPTSRHQGVTVLPCSRAVRGETHGHASVRSRLRPPWHTPWLLCAEDAAASQAMLCKHWLPAWRALAAVLGGSLTQASAQRRGSVPAGQMQAVAAACQVLAEGAATSQAAGRLEVHCQTLWHAARALVVKVPPALLAAPLPPQLLAAGLTGAGSSPREFLGSSSTPLVSLAAAHH